MQICKTHAEGKPGVGRMPAPAQLLAVMLVVASATAHAGDGDPLSVVLSQTFLRDDNLFRLADGQRPILNGVQRPRDDLLSITSAALRLDRRVGRQQINAELGVTRNDYQEFNHLDFTSQGGSATWGWLVGSQWSGELSARQDEKLRSFADRGNTERSVNTYRRYAFDANYLVHPQWSGGLGVATVSSRYDDALSASSEFVEDAMEATVSFHPGSGNRISLVTRATDGRYPNRIAGATTVTGYDQRDIQLRGFWQPSGQSRISGYLGYTWRDYPRLSEKNFSGFTGRVSYAWEPTGKLTIGVIARRELGAQEDVVDNFVVTRAFAVEPIWNLSSKVAIRGRYEWQGRDYGGDPFASGAVDRDDKTRVSSVDAVWKPMRSLELSVGARRDLRSSSDASRRYSSESVVVAARCVF